MDKYILYIAKRRKFAEKPNIENIEDSRDWRRYSAYHEEPFLYIAMGRLKEKFHLHVIVERKENYNLPSVRMEEGNVENVVITGEKDGKLVGTISGYPSEGFLLLPADENDEVDFTQGEFLGDDYEWNF